LAAGIGTAAADTVSNSLDASVDISLETLRIKPGDTAQVNFTVNATNGDGRTGCNFGAFTLSPPARLTVAIGALPGGIASFSPSSLTFTSCGVSQAVTVTGGATEGTALAAAVPTFSNTLTIFDTTPSAFTVINDATDPSTDCTPAAADGEWHASNQSFSCTASDAVSGLADSADASFSLSTSVADGSDDSNASTDSNTVADKNGNDVTVGPITGNKIDRKKPTTIAFVDGPASGGVYPYGSVPAEPTCTADDGTGSGIASCLVTGYSTAIGAHTLTATATDNVGNTDTSTRNYTVGLITQGFYQPVDMNNVVNTVKSGSTVPLKFELFDDSAEITDTAAIASLKSKAYVCTSNPEDAIETLSPTGGTNLRYDAVAGQFVYNWQTPKSPGTCQKVTVATVSGTSISALFKLK
jgi:hypothetical protein